MKAGRELDALIATKVMGLRVEKDVWDTRTQDELTPKYDYGVRFDSGIFRGHVAESVLRYSADIAAAWTVVEKIAGTHAIQVNSFHPGWNCHITEHGTIRSLGNATSDTAPLAIVLAALKAVGVEV